MVLFLSPTPRPHGPGRSVGATADACKINRIKERCAAWHRRGVVGLRKRTNVDQQQSGSATIPFGLVVWENDAPVSHFYPCAPATAGAQTGSSPSRGHKRGGTCSKGIITPERATRATPARALSPFPGSSLRAPPRTRRPHTAPRSHRRPPGSCGSPRTNL